MIIVVPKPRMNVMVVTIPPKTDLISEPGLGVDSGIIGALCLISN